MLSFYLQLITKYGNIVVGIVLVYGFALLIGFLGLVAVKTSLEWVFQDPSFKHISIAIFYIVFVRWLFGTIFRPPFFLKADDLRVRIVPYFEEAVTAKFEGKDHPFFYGRQIAKNIRRLDGYATRAGTPPLSSFGFNDDKLRQKVKWHDAKEGLMTVDKIMDALNEHSPFRDTSTTNLKLINELELVRAWLLMATEKNIRFALLTRMDHESDLTWSYGRIGFFT